MADAPESPDSNPFDLAKIRQLVRLMRDNGLSEIDLRWGDTKIRLRRNGSSGSSDPTVAVAVVPAAAPAAPVEPTVKPAAADTRVTINSPIVGTFYTAPSPDADPFVAVGGKVNPNTVVCIIEAMKVFNEIPAGVSGTIVEVLVENGAPVEYGQPLFRVEPAK